MTDEVFVEAPARLHFGLLDLRGSMGRLYGGIGAAAPGPTLLVSACAADEARGLRGLREVGAPGVVHRGEGAPGVVLDVTGDDAERAADFARRFLDNRLPGRAIRARVRVHRALPSHAGLGSGTQLALAVARALAELYGVPSDPRDLARAVHRARRSAIGTWTFAGGGLVVEGGRRLESPGNQGVGPLLVRLPFPPTWRCVVAVPRAKAGLSGNDEARAFATLPPPPDGDAERVAQLVLMALLPALVDADLAAFGDALSAIQAMMGRWFAPIQGGTFAPGPSDELIRRMVEWGASGVGQSSWGPSVYGIVDGADAGRRLEERVRLALDRLAPGGAVYEGAFRTAGARVWHEGAT
jgi:beta-ribofuranosylaminobenzene 5'-phosphate synthase